MYRSVLDAIKMGLWDFDPERQNCATPVGSTSERGLPDYRATEALPGSPEKLAVLSERVRLGQPLWHPRDRVSYER